LPARDHRTHTSSTSLSYSDGDQAGPSTDDIDKISTIEAITLEYSYLLSSQLEAMRQHYESQESSSLARLEDLESLEVRARAAEKAKEEAERAREKAERKAEKAIELTRALQANLSAEKAMAEGLTVRIGKLREELERKERERQEKEKEVNALEETVRDLMFSLEAGAMIKANGGVDAGEEGDLVVVPGKEKKKKGRR
jgi:BRCA1-associated protein